MAPHRSDDAMNLTTASAEAELARLYRRYVTMIRERSRRVLGDPGLAEDVTQEAFILLFDRLKVGQAPEVPVAFLYRAATTRALNLIRDRRRRTALLDREAPELVPEVANTTAARDARVDLGRVLAVVDEELATIAVCYYVDGMDQDEIGELLGLHRRTVSRRLDEFRERGRKVLTQGANP